MKKSTKVWMIVAVCLIFIGAILFAVTMTMNRWDYTVLASTENETKEFEIKEDFEDINILSTTEDITVAPSTDGKCRVVFCVPSGMEARAAVEAGKLTVDTHNSSDKIGMIKNFGLGINGETSVTIYLPVKIYGNIEIREATGDISIDDLRTEGLEISTTTGNVNIRSSQCKDVSVNTATGDVELEGVTCENLSSAGNTGDIMLRMVIADGKISIERMTGNVALDGCDAGELEIRTSTGDVTGTLLSDKQFVTKSDTGSIEVPGQSIVDDGAVGDAIVGETVTGDIQGTCMITTGTGDITIKKYLE